MIRRCWRRRGAWIGLACVSSAICLANLGGYRTLTTHETLVAQTAREMLDRGDFVLPTYFGEPRLKKPPLAYWQTMIAYALTGERSEWTARLPAALSAIALVLVVSGTAAFGHGWRIGCLAGLALTTSIHFINHAGLAEADITVMLTVATALACYRRLSGRRAGFTAAFSAPAAERRPARFVWGFWIALALCVLAKGPIGVAFIGLVIGTHSLAARNGSAARRLAAPAPIAVALVLIAAWPIAILVRHPESASIWRHETLGRFVRDPNDVIRPPLYYLWGCLWLTLPWTLLWLLELGRQLVARRRRLNGDEWLWLAWLLAPMALLSLSAGKQEHYLAPALAPCAIWAGRTLRRLLRPPSSIWLAAPSRGRACRLIDRWEERGATLIGPRRIGMAVALVALVVGWRLVGAPLAHGRRPAAQWVQRQTQQLDPAAPIIILGHSAEWLALYVDQSMRRVGSIEELVSAGWADGAWALTTSAVASDLADRVPVVERKFGPRDGAMAAEKRPTLLRLAGPPVVDAADQAPAPSVAAVDDVGP